MPVCFLNNMQAQKARKNHLFIFPTYVFIRLSTQLVIDYRHFSRSVRLHHDRTFQERKLTSSRDIECYRHLYLMLCFLVFLSFPRPTPIFTWESRIILMISLYGCSIVLNIPLRRRRSLFPHVDTTCISWIWCVFSILEHFSINWSIYHETRCSMTLAVTFMTKKKLSSAEPFSNRVTLTWSALSSCTLTMSEMRYRNIIEGGLDNFQFSFRFHHAVDR